MTDAHSVAKDQLRAFVERIERLEAEKKNIADDIRDVKAEAKAMGFSLKALNEIIKLRKKDENERAEEDAILDTYKVALGMIPDFERGGAEEFQAKASDDNGATVQDDEETADSMTGDASRPSRGGDTPAFNSESDAVATVATANPSDERVRPTGSAAANIGGDHVTETPHFAAIRPGLVSNPPANHPLRPNCKNPGSECAGYGSKLCHACAVAVRELETA